VRFLRKGKEMNRLVLFVFLFVFTNLNAASLEIKVVRQKVVEATGQPYGSPGGIYFEIKDVDPFLPYWIQYSHDFKTWEDLYNFGSFGNNLTSPLFHWGELPPEKCFFRIIQKW
tara:strand:+ start:510 stop:851 length:342 start_codon:yes stop_codon:yes gene_type:complete